MGIGNDIKPKKVYRYKTPQHHKDTQTHHHDENEKEKSEHNESYYKSSETRDHDQKSVEDKEDDFFHDYNETKPKKATRERNSDGFLFSNLNAKNITWLFIVALFSIVIYQNFDSIKGLIIKEETSSNNSNANDEYYEGISSNRNSNISANSNANTNASSNLNTNSTPAVATIDKATIKLKVLNGNGLAGSANEVTTTLKTAGFTPAKSSNASKYTYPESIIYYKTGKEEAANLVKAALPDLATTLEISDTIVGTYDVVVVVGKT